MVQVSYPGVYIQEKPSGVRTITGVSTSIGAFFGRAAQGPIDQAVRCPSLADFRRSFGDALPDSDLAHSVAQFFANGGTDCYVVRVANAATVVTAEITLQNWAGADVLRVLGRVAGGWGNGVRLEVDYGTPNPGETFNFRVIQEQGGREVATETYTNLSMDPGSPRYAPAFVTASSALVRMELAVGFDPNAGSFPGFSEARRPLGDTSGAAQTTLDDLINATDPAARRHAFEISVDGSSWVPVSLSSLNPMPGTLPAIASEIETLINDAVGDLVPPRQVSVSIDTEAAAGNQRFLRITAATPGGSDAMVRVRRASANDLAGPLMMGAENGGIELARRSDFRPAPTGTVLRMEDGAGGLGPINALTGLDQNELTSITIGAEPAVPLNAAPYDLVTTAGGDAFFDDALPTDATGHLDGVREKLRIMANAISSAAGSRYRAEVHGYDLVILAKDGTINEAPTAVAFAGAGAGTVGAFEINTRRYSLGEASTSDFVNGGVSGEDGDAPQFADYVGDPALKTGFHALDGVDLFNLMVLPTDRGLSDAQRRQLWGPASIYCASRRAFLIVDPPDAWTDPAGRPAVVQNTADIGALRATVVKDHSAVFYPRILFSDRGLVRPIAPSGAIAGLMARTDATRGVWKAPAGTEADLRGIVGLETRLTDLENGVLNKLAVNCIRTFPSGFVNWGARTLDGSDDIGSEWKYIPIRRLALFIKESLYRGTKWVVFEPNDEPLWANIRLNVGAFMNGLFRQGAFQGGTRDEAFFVKCDSETTTQADRNLGIVNIEVGFAPLKPAEFVIITIQQIAGDLE